MVRHAKEIKEAFKTYSDHLQATRNERSTEVIFITGQSGSGKTTLVPFLTPDDKLPDDVMQKFKDSEPDTNAVTDAKFLNLMPVDKGGGFDG